VTVVVLQVFVSLMLVAGSLVLFVHAVRQRDFDHADRLALAPLDEDTAPNPSEADRPDTSAPASSPGGRRTRA
jgi:nitrogen fixation-related uncharacterized protein